MDKVLDSLPDRLNQIDSVALQLSETAEVQNRTVSGIDVIVKDLTAILNRNFSTTKDIRSDFLELFTKMKESLSYMSELHRDIKSIQDLIYQINLLSLNISIEAVKIGDAGKPFSSISSEIRTLNEKAKTTLDQLNAKEINGRGVDENSSYITETLLPKLNDSAKKMEELLEEKSKPLLELKQIAELNSILDDSVAKGQELSVELKNITDSFNSVEREPIKIEPKQEKDSREFKDSVVRKEDSDNIISRKLVEF